MTIPVFELSPNTARHLEVVPDRRKLNPYVVDEIACNFGLDIARDFQHVYAGDIQTRGLYAAGACTLGLLSQVALLSPFYTSSDAKTDQATYSKFFNGGHMNESQSAFELSRSLKDIVGGAAIVLRMLNLLRPHIEHVPEGTFSNFLLRPYIPAISSWYDEYRGGVPYNTLDDIGRLSKIRTRQDVVDLARNLLRDIHGDCKREYVTTDSQKVAKPGYFDPHKALAASRLLEILGQCALPARMHDDSEGTIASFVNRSRGHLLVDDRSYPQPF